MMPQAKPVAASQTLGNINEAELDLLRRITAQALEYGAAYFSDAPMGHFTKWLQAEVLRAEARSDDRLTPEQLNDLRLARFWDGIF
jgi:hypothetical protein